MQSELAHILNLAIERRITAQEAERLIVERRRAIRYFAWAIWFLGVTFLLSAIWQQADNILPPFLEFVSRSHATTATAPTLPMFLLSLSGGLS